MIWQEGDRSVDYKNIAEWKVYEEDTPQCTSCGIWAPFARYRRSYGTNSRMLTDFCPNCGAKIVALPMCRVCEHSEERDGRIVWKDDGICYSCREKPYVPR